MKKIKDYIINFINGFFMSLADSVPGVSGGTVAFVLGFYDKFITSLDDLFRGTKTKRKDAIIYLIKLGIGWIIGFILAILFLASLFDKHIYELSSLFIGFIIFAIPIVIKEEKDSLKGKYKNIIYFILGALFVCLITYLNRESGNVYNLDNFNIASVIYVFLAGVIAISAMILPGISGSTILLIFGLYIPLVIKVKELIHLNLSAFPILFIFGIGIIIGILYFTKLLRKSLEKRRSATIYAILGMMVASIYSIIMGPTTLENPKPYLNLKTFSFLFFILGGIIILALEGIKYFINNKNNKK